MPYTGSALISHTCLFSWFDIRPSGALDLVLTLHSVINYSSKYGGHMAFSGSHLGWLHARQGPFPL